METLRLHAPIPGTQLHETPYPSCHIGSFETPAGVRIAALAHTLHLNETVFPNATVWDHTSWLRSYDHAMKSMHRQFWAFSSGGRMCLGSNFALQETKLIAAAVYSHFETTIVSDEGIEKSDGYSAQPTGNALFLRLTPVEDGRVF
ncbi:hypothetical protein DCS_04260 [Drechmeria coniospora]|uniref:Cytochrome P450 n=1 Tax=Drechmeria coniospora TaxID=98403 RepID=A0A151GJE8_DRECN|nr:hypothetical protein DCS_04260 [Drechmeria coniospora]KYK57253.1 hypothetical protein DCS_04260 [Drechmeria coniospora]